MLLFSKVSTAETEINFSNANQRLSYSLGNVIGNELKLKKMDLNEPAFSKGFEDSLNGITPLIDAMEMHQLTSDLENQLHSKMGLETTYTIKSRREINFSRQRSGEAFMLANKQRKDVVTLPSGVQYKVITEGYGSNPGATDKVEIELHIHSIEGEPIAYSGAEGETKTYTVNSMIKGLAEAIQLMRAGAQWEVYIPPELAYGRMRRYAHLTVIAEIRLVSIN